MYSNDINSSSTFGRDRQYSCFVHSDNINSPRWGENQNSLLCTPIISIQPPHWGEADNMHASSTLIISICPPLKGEKQNSLFIYFNNINPSSTLETDRQYSCSNHSYNINLSTTLGRKTKLTLMYTPIISIHPPLWGETDNTHASTTR